MAVPITMLVSIWDRGVHRSCLAKVWALCDREHSALGPSSSSRMFHGTDELVPVGGTVVVGVSPVSPARNASAASGF
jgi:hypothetical protein